MGAGETRAGGTGEALVGWPPPLPRVFVAPGILLRYLQEQNRPYSAQDVFGNLQREHGLGKAVRTLSWDSSPWGPSNQSGLLPSRGCHSSRGLPKACRAENPAALL